MNTYTMDERTWDMLLEAYELAVDYMYHFRDESEAEATTKRWETLLNTVVIAPRKGVEQ
tara:strand:+ start:73 stop:249 length:177 start_codon:yes stop_codon:yes gene_type:complete